MDILNDIFKDTLEREGVNISIGSIVHKVFFRRNDKGNTNAHSTLYALYGDAINQGEVFSINGIKYLITKELTSENLTYRKYECIKCNATIKWMYDKNDMIIYDCYMKDLADSMLSKSNIIVLNSKIEIWLPLNADSKRIMLNGRFFCGTYKMVNVVTEFNYLNGLCYLYAERGTTNADSDDEINGIANRWDYEDKPNTYTTSITESAIEIEQDATQTLTTSVSMNGSIMTIQPTVTWTIADGSICSIDSSNLVTGLKVGTTRLTASYKVNDYDTCTTDSVMVTVKEKSIVVGDIVVTPTYTSTYYRLLQGKTQTFTCSISGLSNPQWNITLNANGNTATSYISTINNTNGTFTVQNKVKATPYLIYTITEITTGKSKTYQISLGGMM